MATRSETTPAEKTEISLLDAKGKELGKTSVSGFFSVKPANHLLHQIVRWQRAKRRAGTHKTKTRAEVTGGGKKPWKQKGTGNARAGSNTSSIWVGGGIAHGPKPRDYEFRFNRQEKKQALQGALAARNREGRLLLVSDFGLKKIKTQDAFKALTAIGVEAGASTTILLSKSEEVAAKSLRNIERVKVLPPQGLNAYDILVSKYLVISESALKEVEARFEKSKGE